MNFPFRDSELKNKNLIENEECLPNTNGLNLEFSRFQQKNNEIHVTFLTNNLLFLENVH